MTTVSLEFWYTPTFPKHSSSPHQRPTGQVYLERFHFLVMGSLCTPLIMTVACLTRQTYLSSSNSSLVVVRAFKGKITTDATHSAHCGFYFLPSGRRYRSTAFKTIIYKNSFMQLVFVGMFVTVGNVGTCTSCTDNKVHLLILICVCAAWQKFQWLVCLNVVMMMYRNSQQRDFLISLSFVQWSKTTINTPIFLSALTGHILGIPTYTVSPRPTGWLCWVEHAKHNYSSHPTLNNKFWKWPALGLN